MMCPVETVGLDQKAVLWPWTGRDDDGDPTVGTAVEVNVRWEQGLREADTAEQAPQVATTNVFVDRVIDIGSHMWLGKLADLPANPVKYEVVENNEVPDLKARNFTRTVRLLRIQV